MTAVVNTLPIGLSRVEGNPDVVRIESPELPLPYDLRHALIRAAATSNGNEVCGFITSRMSPYFLLNVSETPDKNYVCDLKETRRAIELISAGNDRVIGFFHSHPSGFTYPGIQDMAGWPNPDLNWRYFIVTTTGVFEYRLIADDERI